MKPAIIKRSALLLALVCVLALLGAPRASAANQVADIRINAVLQDDGSADITQTWTATTDEGTEFYLACRDNGYLSITDFTVSDERGTYEPLASWVVGADFTQKARKCGVVETGEGVELCWGITEYGRHDNTVSYDIGGLAGAYSDAAGFNNRFIDPDQSIFPTKASVTALGRPPSTTLMLLPSPSPDTVNCSTASSSIQRGWRNSRLRNGSLLP